MRLSMMPSPNNPASTVSVTTKDTLKKTGNREKYIFNMTWHFNMTAMLCHNKYTNKDEGIVIPGPMLSNKKVSV